MQNGLFNLITSNIQSWQQYSRPPWFASMPGGYDIDSEVIRLKGTVWTPYRSLVTGNVTDPLNAPASWEYIPYGHEMLANVPMPAGGPSGSSGRLITVSTDFNTFTNPGTYEFQSDAIVTGSPHTPSTAVSSAVAGILEVDAWVNGAVTYVIQRYLDRNGIIFTRSSTTGSWGAWSTIVNLTQVQAGSSWYAVDTGVANAYVAPLTPGLASRTDGMVIRLRIKNANTGPSTIDDGLGPVPIWNRNMVALKGGEIVGGGGEVWLSWHAGGAVYIIAAQIGGAFQLGGGSYVGGNGVSPTFLISDPGNGVGANLKLVGNGATTPSKTIRAVNGNFNIVNDAASANLFTVTDAGNATVGGSLTVVNTIVLSAGQLQLGTSPISSTPPIVFGGAVGNAMFMNANATSSPPVIQFINTGNTVVLFTIDNNGNTRTAAAHTVGGSFTVTSGTSVMNGRLTMRTGPGVGGASGEIGLISGDGTGMYLRGRGSAGGMQWVNNAYNNIVADMDDTGYLRANVDSANVLRAGAATGGTRMVFNWSGQGGQPSWLWGGNDGVNMYVYNPSGFSVNYAASAGSVGGVSSPATAGSQVPWNSGITELASAMGGNNTVDTGSPWVAEGLRVTTGTDINRIYFHCIWLRNQ
jgi:hypothetical protein